MFEAKLGFSGGGAEACLTQKIYHEKVLTLDRI